MPLRCSVLIIYPYGKTCNITLLQTLRKILTLIMYRGTKEKSPFVVFLHPWLYIFHLLGLLIHISFWIILVVLMRSNQVKIKPADRCSLPCRSAHCSQREEPVCAVKCFWGLLHPQLKPWLQPAELRFRHRSRAVLQATAASWVTAPALQKCPHRAQLCPSDLLRGVYVKALCTATSQGHLFDLGHLFFDIICKHFWKHNE